MAPLSTDLTEATALNMVTGDMEMGNLGTNMGGNLGMAEEMALLGFKSPNTSHTSHTSYTSPSHSPHSSPSPPSPHTSQNYSLPNPSHTPSHTSHSSSHSSPRSHTPSRPRTLSFVTPAMQAHMLHLPETGIVLVPLSFRLLLGAFVVAYFGMFHSYSGWIASYSMVRHLTLHSSQAARLTSTYYTFLTLGSALSIPLSVYVSSTALLRVQLCIVAIGAILLVLEGWESLFYLTVATAFLGYGNSCIFPLALCLANDYGYTMDTAATTNLVMCATVGEAVFPIIMSTCIARLGPSAFPTLTFALSGAMVALYVLLDVWSRYAEPPSPRPPSPRSLSQSQSPKSPFPQYVQCQSPKSHVHSPFPRSPFPQSPHLSYQSQSQPPYKSSSGDYDAVSLHDGEIL
ncbi:hypothetical protein B484DRAFT_368175 [Ochromonadaceae sp. CCMP2298]|nr:hypothetical protein B484DRAFT_368175 [Ochromonadaceae sp. CCMP2298]